MIENTEILKEKSERQTFLRDINIEVINDVRGLDGINQIKEDITFFTF